ncbi:HAMP domain-containing sensor histidine kinase [Thermotoga sp. SG1]|uniref:sensor histidine kinase n=1 Tax=Thermotoga sp. SG1 TaxID=126739 RepID=UPI000C76E1A5|nr:ATP-binding protein [Thermotoga sp. SG1]PLV57166.1 ATPase [Thermotoga sp. SG1]
MLRTIADHLMDVAQNSVKAGARNVKIIIEETDEWFTFTVEDDGPGIEDPEKVFDPFFTTRDPRLRKVGLGLPFLKQAAEQSGGRVSLWTHPGKGTVVKASFNLKSVDCQPIGDLASTLVSLILSDPNVNWYVLRKKDGRGYEIDTGKLKKDGLWAPENPKFASFLFETLENLEEDLRRGEKDG